jgi:hypothetical protein
MSVTSGQLGRSRVPPSKRSSKTQLPGTIRKKGGYSGSTSLFSQLSGRQPGGPLPGSDGSGGTATADSRAGVLTGTIRSSVSDSEPVSVNNKASGASSGTSPAVYDAGSVWTSIKSGLTAYMPAILVIGSVVLGIVIIKSAGGKGRR